MHIKSLRFLQLGVRHPRLYLVVFAELVQHHDCAGRVVVRHSPDVNDRVRKGRLGQDVRQPRLVALKKDVFRTDSFGKALSKMRVRGLKTLDSLHSRTATRHSLQVNEEETDRSHVAT